MREEGGWLYNLKVEGAAKNLRIVQFLLVTKVFALYYCQFIKKEVTMCNVAIWPRCCCCLSS